MKEKGLIIIPIFTLNYSVKPLNSGHPRDSENVRYWEVPQLGNVGSERVAGERVRDTEVKTKVKILFS